MSRITCPVCEKEFDPSETEAMPFCCERCRLIDLGRWLDEENAIPGELSEEDFFTDESPD